MTRILKRASCKAERGAQPSLGLCRTDVSCNTNKQLISNGSSVFIYEKVRTVSSLFTLLHSYVYSSHIY